MFFEDVHFGDLDRDAIPEADNASGAAADEMVARRIEEIKIICYRRKRNQTGHAQAGHIDKEPHIAHVGHERGVTLRLPGP